MDFNDSRQAGDIKEVPNPWRESGDRQTTAAPGNANVGGHKGLDPQTVDQVDPRQIQHDVNPAGFSQFPNRPAQFASAVIDGQFTLEAEDRDSAAMLGHRFHRGLLLSHPTPSLPLARIAMARPTSFQEKRRVDNFNDAPNSPSSQPVGD